jgi:hypothetical protein
MGYFCCVVEVLALVINMYFIIRGSLKAIILKVRVCWAKSEKRISRTKHLRSRAKCNVMRRRRNKRRIKQKELNDYGFELDEEH